MAVPTINVTGNVVAPNGAGVTGGRIVITLIKPGSVLDGATNQRIGGTIVETIGVTGSVSFPIVPNDKITPSGGLYEAVYFAKTTFPHTWREIWGPILDDTSIDIGDIPRPPVDPTTFHLFGEHSDQVAGVPVDGNVWSYQASTGKWVLGPGGVGSATLVALTDTSIVTPVDAESLVYEAARAVWKNSTVKLVEFTTAGRPAETLANKNRVIVVKDAGQPGKVQFLLENASGGSFKWKDGPRGDPT